MIRYSPAVRRVALGCALSIAPLIAAAQNYTQTNLVSDISGMAVSTDANLKNPWGLARGAGSPFWPTNEGTGTAVLYTGSGGIVPLVVTIPNATGVSGPSQPTGIIFNGTADFALSVDSSPALFMFATKEGTIAGWNQGLTPLNEAVTVVDESKQGSVFLGLTWVEVEGQHFLLAANFAGRRIEAFNTHFASVPLDAFQFFDPFIPRDFAPYNVQAVGNNVVVTYARQNATKTAADDSNCSDGCGVVDVFTKRGIFVQRLQGGKWLQSPWGVALAPQDFGFFSHDLLIGNRASGTIAAFNPVDGRFIGNLEDTNSDTLVISGLWAIEFDNRAPNEFGTTTTALPVIGGSTTLSSTGPALFFVAGINNYADGLYGALTPTAPELNAEDHE
ncbi:MAG TPA: TIGR03118 family protein [Steroidobacteraceae bacterium]|jgi:uncharacterized protein (TIGR03118 family)|nr:TIGR03118 family protein [Steroidobacteraceae bacterium]